MPHFCETSSNKAESLYYFKSIVVVYVNVFVQLHAGNFRSCNYVLVICEPILSPHASFNTVQANRA